MGRRAGAIASGTGRGGFTLLELILVLVIVGALAALIGTRLGTGLAGDRLVVAARDLAATLRLASDRAQLSGRRHRVLLGLEGGYVVVEEEDDPLDAPDEWSPVQLQWARKRAFARPVRFGVVTVDPDDDEYREELDAEATEVVELLYTPDGVHVLRAEDVLEVEPEEGIAIEITLHGEGDEDTGDALYLRIEPTGRVRVWTPEDRQDHEDAVEDAARVSGGGGMGGGR